MRIILSDGEITANKNVLASQCEYFAANIRWKEQNKDKSDHIEITDCSKEVMERIIKYLFTGSIKFKDLGLLKLLELVNQVRKFLLKSDLQCLIESYIVKDILSFPSIKHLRTKYEDIIRGLQYADKFSLDVVRDFLLRTNLYLLPYIAKDTEAISAFSTLPLQIIKDLFSFPRINEIFRTKKSQRVFNSAQFRCFWAWYQGNKDTCPEDKKKIMGTIDLDLFRATELFLLVKPSGLFPDDEVDKRIVECLHERDEMKNLAVN